MANVEQNTGRCGTRIWMWGTCITCTHTRAHIHTHAHTYTHTHTHTHIHMHTRTHAHTHTHSNINNTVFSQVVPTGTITILKVGAIKVHLHDGVKATVQVLFTNTCNSQIWRPINNSKRSSKSGRLVCFLSPTIITFSFYASVGWAPRHTVVVVFVHLSVCVLFCSALFFVTATN